VEHGVGVERLDGIDALRNLAVAGSELGARKAAGPQHLELVDRSPGRARSADDPKYASVLVGDESEFVGREGESGGEATFLNAKGGVCEVGETALDGGSAA